MYHNNIPDSKILRNEINLMVLSIIGSSHCIVNKVHIKSRESREGGPVRRGGAAAQLTSVVMRQRNPGGRLPPAGLAPGQAALATLVSAVSLHCPYLSNSNLQEGTPHQIENPFGVIILTNTDCILVNRISTYSCLT